MTKEERNAIEHFKNLNLYAKTNLDLQYTESEIDNSKILIDIIENQQKELILKDKAMNEMARWIIAKDYAEDSLCVREDIKYFANLIEVVKYRFINKVKEIPKNG